MTSDNNKTDCWVGPSFYCRHAFIQLSIVYSNSSSSFIDRNEKKRTERTREQHCCQIAKIQQTHIKVQSHKITITKRSSN